MDRQLMPKSTCTLTNNHNGKGGTKSTKVLTWNQKSEFLCTEPRTSSKGHRYHWTLISMCRNSTSFNKIKLKKTTLDGLFASCRGSEGTLTHHTKETTFQKCVCVCVFFLEPADHLNSPHVAFSTGGIVKCLAEWSQREKQAMWSPAGVGRGGVE